MKAFKIAKIDETKYWNKEFLREFDIKKMIGIYVFDPNESTNCCEITPSYCLHFVHSNYEFNNEPSNDNFLEKVSEAVMESDIEETVKYIHCKDVEKNIETIEHGEFESIEDAIEDANAN